MSDRSKSALLMMIVVVLDQVSKWSVMTCMSEPVEITSFLSFHLTYNRGISWGLFNGAASWLFVVITGIICMLTISLCVYAYQQRTLGNAIDGELLVIAGSFSNCIDRIIHSGVVDFIVIHLGEYTWPVFNLADIAIVVGVFIMFLQHIIFPRREVVLDA